MRRRALLAMALAAGLGTTLVRGDEGAPTTTTTAPPAGMTQQTTVEGTVPSLDGRWLLLTSVTIGNGPKRTLASVLEGTRADGRQQLVERHVVLPTEQAAALQRANDELGGAWEPSPADMEEIAAAFDRLEPDDRGIAEINHFLNGRDAYDDEMRGDALTREARWVYRQQYVFHPGGNRPINQGNLLAVLRDENGVYSGTYVALAVAGGVFPVPIRFDGAFRLIPLGPPPTSIWTRLGSFFSGCN